MFIFISVNGLALKGKLYFNNAAVKKMKMKENKLIAI